MTVEISENKQHLIDKLTDVIRTHLHPKKILLFGSRATGRDKSYSDFDIAVEGVEINIRKERLVKEALDRRLGIFTVDLIYLDSADKDFKDLVLKTGKVLYEQ
ncbi:MAG: nucleotidyltransferase domain-containing protein [Nitrospirae bacterium]|nr:nucleotidyltransferase domain-containing protein [Nitrospirota bacterium]